MVLSQRISCNDIKKWQKHTLLMIIVPTTEMKIKSNDVHIAAKPAILSAVPSEDNLAAAMHATMKATKTKTYFTSSESHSAKLLILITKENSQA